jgi:DNA-binding transcriptional regulator YhcF (GntR family)
MGEVIGKAAVPKKQAFVQIEREALHEWARFMMKHQRAASVLGHMTALMDKQAAVVISHKTLAKLSGCSLPTIKRALDDLEKGNWIQVVKIGPTGTVNAYVINSRVAWCDLRDNKKMAIFSARIVADAEEQDERTLSNEKLRRIPMVHPPEEALPSGEWPLNAQAQLPGIEAVAVGTAEDDAA